jgi:hypothetical protein
MAMTKLVVSLEDGDMVDAVLKRPISEKEEPGYLVATVGVWSQQNEKEV